MRWSASSEPLCLLPTDCHDVLMTASSPSLELLAKCDLDSFSSLPLSLTSPQQDQLRILAQVSSNFIYTCTQLNRKLCTCMFLLHYGVERFVLFPTFTRFISSTGSCIPSGVVLSFSLRVCQSLQGYTIGEKGPPLHYRHPTLCMLL